MIKYQGEDIYFALNFNTEPNSGITSFNDLYNVVVYMYTNQDNIVKFSRIPKDGYSPLIDNNEDGSMLSGVIDSIYTKDMLGQILIDIMCIKTSDYGDLNENIIQKARSGILISPSLIKEEI